MEAYLDNSATTCVHPEVAELMEKLFCRDFGNPSSMHRKGIEAEKYIKEARKCIAQTLKANEKEILFTSGGTESDNMALIGTCLANRRRGNHIIISGIEHPAVWEPAQFLANYGFELTVLPVDERGIVDADALCEAVTDSTILVSIMYVNNEIGTVEPIEELAGLIKKKNPDTIFHVDAIQAYGKLRIAPKKLGIDLMSVSGHKIHGPKGVGFLYIREGVKIKPILYGGGQQKGLRSGTDNVPGIAGLGLAAKLAYENFEEKQEYLYHLREHFIGGLSAFDDIEVNGSTDRSFAPHIVNIRVKNVRSEVLLHALEEREIYISAGSACSSNKPAPSRSLLAVGVPKTAVECSVRISFSVQNTVEQVDYLLKVLKEVVPVLQKYVRK